METIMNKFQNRRAFSLMESIIAVVAVAVIAAIAVPKYLATVERGRAVEGATILRSLCDAQRAYFAEHGQYRAGSGTNGRILENDLDIVIGTTRHFQAPRAMGGDGSQGVAAIRRLPNEYELTISLDCRVACADFGNKGCAKAGYPRSSTMIPNL